MDPQTIEFAAEVLTATGPYGLVAALAWAFWKAAERKDKELKVLSNKVIEMASVQTEVAVRVEAALVALTKAIENLAGRNRPAA